MGWGANLSDLSFLQSSYLTLMDLCIRVGLGGHPVPVSVLLSVTGTNFYFHSPFSQMQDFFPVSLMYRRACRFPSICGERMMIYEEAFCFRRGSHCEEIFHRNNNPSYRQPNSDDMDYLDRSSSSSSSFGDSSSSSSVSNESKLTYADCLSHIIA